MDRISKNMESFVKHLGGLPRALPSRFPLQTVGYIGRKPSWVRTSFFTCNFSFILRGGGEFRMAGRVLSVVAPCVLVELPGMYQEYGPTAEFEGSWDELFFIYDKNHVKNFQKAALLPPGQMVWGMRNEPRFQEELAEFLRLLKNPGARGNADRIDRTAERMILETLLEPAETPPTATTSMAEKIRSKVSADPGRSWDWERVARDHGLSPATFRRAWQTAEEMPPGKFLAAVRLQTARRLLVETMQPIHQVATECGFQDPLYFSRWFRDGTGLSPRAYRRNQGWRQLANSGGSQVRRTK